MSAIDSFHIPATSADAQKLAENRATLWPSMLLVCAIIVAITTILMFFLGIIPVLITLVIIGALLAIFLVAYGMSHNMTKAEQEQCVEELPGHNVFASEDIKITGGKSYDFDCAPTDIFPYFKQFNLIKAGYYSYDWLERFFGFHIVNDYTIRPEWQSLEPGDWIYYHQMGAGTGIVNLKENEYIVTYSDTRYKPTQELAVAWRPKWMKGFAWTWNFIFVPTNNGEGTHFITYLQAWWPEETSKPTILRLLIEWAIPSNIMMNGMASRVKKLAERDAKARRAGCPRPGYNYTK